MAISVDKYISIKTVVNNDVVGDRDFSGLVFYKAKAEDLPSGSKDDGYNDLRKSFNDGEVTRIYSADAALKMFGQFSDMFAFATEYFGYEGRPVALNLARVGSDLDQNEKPTAAYTRVIEDFTNFGSFTVLGEFPNSDLVDLATTNASSDFAYIRAIASTGEKAKEKESDLTEKILGPDAVCKQFDGIKGCHCFCDVQFKQGEETGSGEEKKVEYTNKDYTVGASKVMAWYASTNYNSPNASGTPDYKSFGGSTPTVYTDAMKEAYDKVRLNYIGRVKVHGSGLSFYQTGVNMDGTDLGVFRDAVWIKSEIESGWFNLVSRLQKVPANQDGVSTVVSMIAGVAQNAVDNGSILPGKYLDNSDNAAILSYAGNTSAPSMVATVGYYIGARIVKEEGRYKCVYILVYAKGDHIYKVDGTHYLI